MSIGVSSSFNKTLWREVGAVVGREARGGANADIYGLDALTFWAVSFDGETTERLCLFVLRSSPY